MTASGIVSDTGSDVCGDICVTEASSGVSEGLLTNIVAYYDLEEEDDATRLDAVGSLDLPSVGTPGSRAGHVGTFATDTTQAKYFELATAGALGGTDRDFTVCAWGKYDTATNWPTILTNADGIGSGDVSWGLGKDNGGGFRFWIFNVNTPFIALEGTPSTPLNGTWYFVAGGYDSVNNEVWCSLNDGAKYTTGSVTGINDGSAKKVRLGGMAGYSQNFMDGAQDAWGFWDENLSLTKLAALYNSGDGRLFATLT